MNGSNSSTSGLTGPAPATTTTNNAAQQSQNDATANADKKGEVLLFFKLDLEELLINSRCLHKSLPNDFFLFLYNLGSDSGFGSNTD